MSYYKQVSDMFTSAIDMECAARRERVMVLMVGHDSDGNPMEIVRGVDTGFIMVLTFNRKSTVVLVEIYQRENGINTATQL